MLKLLVLKNKLSNLDFRGIFMNSLKFVGAFIFLLAVIILIIIIAKYWHTSEFIKSAQDINSSSSGLTSSIGAIISGTVGVMFSLCSVIFFILALMYQQNELKLQRKEIRESRKLVHLQAFESTFFNLLKVQQDIRERISKVERPNFNGRFLGSTSNTEYWDFEKLYNSFKSIAQDDLKKISNVDFTINVGEHVSFTDYLLKNYHLTKADLEANPRVANYKRWFHTSQSVLGNYHRNLFHTLKYIYEAETDEEFEVYMEDDIVDIWINGEYIKDDFIYLKYRKYADFVQAQMSTDELALVFYNGLLFPKMKVLIKHYDLLEQLPYDYLVESSDADFYE